MPFCGYILIGVTEDGDSLFQSDAWEPRQELIDRGAILKVLEESLHRHTSALKHPGTAYLIFHPLDFRAIAPIQHEVHGMLAISVRQGLNTFTENGQVL